MRSKMPGALVGTPSSLPVAACPRPVWLGGGRKRYERAAASGGASTPWVRGIVGVVSILLVAGGRRGVIFLIVIAGLTVPIED